MTNANPIRFVLLCVLLLAGCATQQPNLALLGPDTVYQRATEAYEAGDWDRAIQMLDFFVQQYVGDERAAQARLLLGKAHAEQDEYVTAATHFQRLVSDFPSSPLNLEARFLMCDAYMQLSPQPALDQEYTHAAIAHCQSVASNYPSTEEGQQAAEHLAQLREKLARKMYDTGAFYLRRRAYDAAVVYFEDVVERFPSTELAPAALQQLVNTYTLIGYVEEADAARERLLEGYPDSPEAQALRTQ